MKVMVLGLALIAAPVSAEPVELWNGVHVGDTLDTPRVDALPSRVEISPDCRPYLDFRTEKKLIESVRLYGGSALDKGCFALLRDGLRTKYGEPVSNSLIPAAGGRDTITRETTTFQNATVRVTLKTATDSGYLGGYNYEVIYEPRSNVEKAAQSL